jgi:hypothetical protein
VRKAVASRYEAVAFLLGAFYFRRRLPIARAARITATVIARVASSANSIWQISADFSVDLSRPKGDARLHHRAVDGEESGGGRASRKRSKRT